MQFVCDWIVLKIITRGLKYCTDIDYVRQKVATVEREIVSLNFGLNLWNFPGRQTHSSIFQLSPSLLPSTAATLTFPFARHPLLPSIQCNQPPIANHVFGLIYIPVTWVTPVVKFPQFSYFKTTSFKWSLKLNYYYSFFTLK